MTDGHILTENNAGIKPLVLKGRICKDEYKLDAPIYYVASECFDTYDFGLFNGDKVKILILEDHD